VQDGIAIAALLAFYFVVHDVKLVLTAPYWLDEAWVALSVRFPISELPLLTSSTPLGWTFLLRLVPDSDYLRVVPLAFDLLVVVCAYVLGRLLAWQTRLHGTIAGVACGLAVLLLPAQQARHDLKQYTADAAVTLGLLVLAAWTERHWSRKRLGVIVAFVAVGMLVSHVTAVAAPCTIGGLVLVTALRRQWRRLVEVLVAGAAAGLVVGIIYLGISSRNQSQSLQTFWAANFPTLRGLPAYLDHQFYLLELFLGLPPYLWVALIAAGIATLAWRGLGGVAIAAVLLPLAAIVLGVAKIYPLLEQRTGNFLLVTGTALAGLGVAGAAIALATLARRLVPRLPAVVPTIAAAVACALVIGWYGVYNDRWYRFDGNEWWHYSSIAIEDSRSATAYVAANRAPNDVIVVSFSGRYGFTYYWHEDPIVLHEYPNTVGWDAIVPSNPGIVFIKGESPEAIREGLDAGIRLAAERGGGARVFLIRSHIIGDEVAAWKSVLPDYQVEQVTNGVEPVVLVNAK
jgi:hypothetical protein